MERGQVSFHCVHSYAWTNSKYFCRHPCQEEKDKVIAVNSRQTAESGRFSLHDGGNELTVNISRLQLSDAGFYYCGVDRVGYDTFIEVHLTVDKGTRTQKSAGEFLGVLMRTVVLVFLLFYTHTHTR